MITFRKAATVAAVCSLAALGGAAVAQGWGAPGYGPGYGMGPGYGAGPGYGPGPGGMPPGMMQGWGGGPGGMPPGMMQGHGMGPGGMSPGMMQGMGPGGMQGMMQGMGPGGMTGGRFFPLDTDGDGAVSAEEAAAAAERRFAVFDVDDDGVLTIEEFATFRMQPPPWADPDRIAAMQARRAARLAELDADADGQVTKAEFMQAAEAHHAAADSDGDGRVTPWEHRRSDWD
jgi:hypothetical protein